MKSQVYVLLLLLSFVSNPIIHSQEMIVNWSGGNICDQERTSYNELVFEDHFDGEELDLTKWYTYFNCRGKTGDQCAWSRTHGNEGQIYLDENISIEDSICTIRVDKEDLNWFGESRSYTSGMIRSKETFSHYGRFEIRCDMPSGDGIWPNFWLFGYGTELDVAEFREKENRYLVAVHRFEKGELTKPDWCCLHVEKPYSLTSGMHVYAVEYNPYRVKFYLDDVLQYTMPRYITMEGKGITECGYYPPQKFVQHNAFPIYGKPLNLIVDISVIRENAKAQNVNLDDIKIDYIKAYKRKPANIIGF